VGRYLVRLARGTAARLEVMLSHGGTAPARAASAVRTLLSGPAAGAVAALERARAAGFRRALSLDVGGTSTDVAFLPGRLERRRDRLVGGFPVRLPLVDVHTVGAGGGSIARFDAGGLLVVGPESAGARPGPAAYGRGGPATVTDALIVLGRIVPELFAGGEMPLDAAASTSALRALGAGMGRDAVEAAWGVLQVANANMERALRFISVERGEDPRDAALVAFGGAGGLHACELGEALGMAAVVAPRHAGLLSACGLVSAEARHERTLSVLVPAAEAPKLERRWRTLEAEVRAEFAREPGPRGAPRLERWAELRYRGQSHELSLPWGPAVAERFHREHERRYGHAQRHRPIEIVTLEVRGAVPAGRAVRSPAPRGPARVRPWGTTRARVAGGLRRVPVWRREQLPRGFAARGPALVVEYGSSVWVAPGWRARVAADGSMLIVRGRRR
jgi:N-methylhydantoinase A